jgi:hypothetical protein
MAPINKYQFEILETLEKEQKATGGLISKQRSLEQVEKKIVNATASGKPTHDLIMRADDLKRQIEKYPKTEIVLGSGYTPESLAIELRENNQFICWATAEGGSFFNSFDQYAQNGNADIELILKGYTGENWSKKRVVSGVIRLSFPRVSVVLVIQPKTLRRMIGGKNKFKYDGTGLKERFILIDPDKPETYQRFDTPAISEKILKKYRDNTNIQLNWPANSDDKLYGGTYLLQVEKNARGILGDYHDKLSKKRHNGYYRDDTAINWTAKAHGQAVRLATQFHTSGEHIKRPWKCDINEKTMQAAVDIMKPLEFQTLKAFGILNESEDIGMARKVLEVSTQLGDVFRKRTLQRKLSVSSESLQHHLDTLADRDYIFRHEDVGRRDSYVCVFR